MAALKGPLATVKAFAKPTECIFHVNDLHVDFFFSVVFVVTPFTQSANVLLHKMRHNVFFFFKPGSVMSP